MTGRFGGENVPVALPGGCRCPGTPHAQDEVYLLPRLTFEGGARSDAVIAAHLERGDTADLGRALSRVYLTEQVAGWNLTGEGGLPLPFAPALLLSDWEASRVVADKADDLYSEVLLAPLVTAASKSSPAGRTAASTSARTRTASRPRKR